ncbi:MAG: phosphoglucosamine mutase [Flavobacteriales bacterium]
MTLIKSISGIRGTIGGKAGECLSPLDAVKFSIAFATLLQRNQQKNGHAGHALKVVIGRDARISGDMLNRIVSGTLMGMGVNVVDCSLSTTPSVEMAVVAEKADGGIILTASHNPKNWNALKLLNAKGEFISEEEGETLLHIAESDDLVFPDVNHIGKYQLKSNAIEEHIAAILKIDMVDKQAIEKANFKIVIDGINSTGSIAVPMLLEALGVSQITVINEEAHGDFAHNPEPLPDHLLDLSNTVTKKKAHLGISVDPDVDRLAFVCEDGEMFGEEYTLVAVADYVLKHRDGNSVSNLSSTKALRDITEKKGKNYFASAVGEVNVVNMMKQNNAVIGGEGNGGIILPELHYGRDALVGIALFLSHLAKFGKPVSMLKAVYPQYYISKNKIELTADTPVDTILERVREKYKKQPAITIDGLKVEFENSWVHLRKSNTEPIIRIYAEAQNIAIADKLANKIIEDIKEIHKELSGELKD